MSIKVSFFAADRDVGTLHSFLRETIRPLYVIQGERGDENEVMPRLVTEDSLLKSHRKLFLVTDCVLQFIVYHDLGDTYPNQRVVDENVSPVLVYNPSIVESDGSLRVGRFYYAYPGEIPEEFKKSIRRVFSWVRHHSVPVPTMMSFRILEGAKKVGRLRQWVGPPQANPFIEWTQCGHEESKSEPLE
jgi:hypothetical protein